MIDIFTADEPGGMAFALDNMCGRIEACEELDLEISSKPLEMTIGAAGADHSLRLIRVERKNHPNQDNFETLRQLFRDLSIMIFHFSLPPIPNKLLVKILEEDEEEKDWYLLTIDRIQVNYL